MMDDAKKTAVQISFVKDTVAGAATLLVFASFGWPQWTISAVHVLSVPGTVLQIEGTALTVYLLIATLAAIVADLVIVLTLTCGISNCCAPGMPPRGCISDTLFRILHTNSDRRPTQGNSHLHLRQRYRLAIRRTPECRAAWCRRRRWCPSESECLWGLRGRSR